MISHVAGDPTLRIAARGYEVPSFGSVNKPYVVGISLSYWLLPDQGCHCHPARGLSESSTRTTTQRRARGSIRKNESALSIKLSSLFL